MFITKKHIPRRTFLAWRRQSTLALPFLEVDASGPNASEQDGGGARLDQAIPRHLASPWRGSRLLESAAGRQDFEFSFITKPLEPFRDHVRLISGLNMNESFATEEEPGGDHAKGAALLSGARPRRNAVQSVPGRDDRSIDRRKIRPGHDPVFDSARRGRHHQLRQLQLGL